MWNLIRIIARVIAGALLTVIVIAGLYFLSAFTLSHISVNKENNSSNDVVIYIATNGVHTDVIVPVKNDQVNWSKEIKYTDTAGKDTAASYVSIGWGDKAFYLQTPDWADLKPDVAFHAAFGLSASALHTTYYQTVIESASCKRLWLSTAQYVRLVNYIQKSFKTDKSGHVINIVTKANYDSRDAFYDANRHYSLFYTCNTWTNNALKICGQKACFWTPFANGIFNQYK